MGIDSAILDLTERLCHRIQLLTGRTNVWLAFQVTNLSVIVYFVWAVLYFPNLPGITRAPVAVFCAGVLFALSQSVFKVSIDASESNAYRRVAKGLRNPRRVRDAPLRLAFLTLSILLLYPLLFIFFTFGSPIALLTYALVGLTAIVLYLLGCDPLPPCRGKITEWVRAWMGRRAPAEQVPELGAGPRRSTLSPPARRRPTRHRGGWRAASWSLKAKTHKVALRLVGFRISGASTVYARVR